MAEHTPLIPGRKLLHSLKNPFLFSSCPHTRPLPDQLLLFVNHLLPLVLRRVIGLLARVTWNWCVFPWFGCHIDLVRVFGLMSEFGEFSVGSQGRGEGQGPWGLAEVVRGVLVRIRLVTLRLMGWVVFVVGSLPESGFAVWEWNLELILAYGVLPFDELLSKWQVFEGSAKSSISYIWVIIHLSRSIIDILIQIHLKV